MLQFSENKFQIVFCYYKAILLLSPIYLFFPMYLVTVRSLHMSVLV